MDIQPTPNAPIPNIKELHNVLKTNQFVFESKYIAIQEHPCGVNIPDGKNKTNL